MRTKVADDQLIGLVLSGGGIRAAVFHLGVLRQLADQDLFESVEFVSTVSGGSLLLGLVLHHSGFQWPNSQSFRDDVWDRVRTTLRDKSLQRAYILELLKPWNLLRFRFRTHVFAKCLRGTWGIHGQLADYPGSPALNINATLLESGSRFVFRNDARCESGPACAQGESGRLRGATTVWLADALAASAAFPGGFSPLEHPRVPSRHPPTRDLGYTPAPWWPTSDAQHLVDGGVYDNLGMEPLFDVNTQAIKPSCRCDFLFVSDGGAPLGQRSVGWFTKLFGVSKRIVDIATDQTRMLRMRSFNGFLKRYPKCGAKVTIGAPAAWLPPVTKRKTWPIGHPALLGTWLMRLSEVDFDATERHGYSQAAAALKPLDELAAPTVDRVGGSISHLP